jgi:hypothetical protein
MGQQTNVENVVPLVASEIVEEEKMQLDETVEKTSKGDANQVETDLERITLMIENQHVAYVVPLPKQKNANEDVQPHAHIDGDDIAIELHLL